MFEEKYVKWLKTGFQVILGSEKVQNVLKMSNYSLLQLKMAKNDDSKNFLKMCF